MDKFRGLQNRGETERQMKKIMGAKSWYRRKRKVEEDDEPVGAGTGALGRNNRESKKRKLEWNAKEDD